MPIGIGIHGGLTRDDQLRNVSSEKALESLEQIRTHLSQPGRDSGVLTLFNRSKIGTEITLERKSGFQLLFHKEERLDETVQTMKTMLEKAGKHEAVDELENYLSSQGGNQNRISSRKMLEILNRHLPMQGPPLQELQVPGNERDPEILNHDLPLEGSTLEELYESGKIEKGQKLGSGGFGTAYLVKVGGDNFVLKEFRKPETLSLQRSPIDKGRYQQPSHNESIGSYLTSKRHPNYLVDKVNIAQPTSYLVSVEKEAGEQQFQIVNPHQMRSLVKTGVKVECHGLLMAPAKGKDLKTLVEKGELNDTQKKQFLRSTLHSLKGLNERGFVHCDIKPDNTFFDKKNGITTLIDTGMLFKRSKDQEKHGGTQYVEGYENQGTMPYMHPRLLDGEKHGTERDLWAVGLMALKVHNPVAYDHFIENKRNLPESLLSENWLRDELDRQIEQAEPRVVKKALEALRRDIDNGDTIAGFAKECFDKALLPAEEWNNLGSAQKMYDDLMKHGGLE